MTTCPKCGGKMGMTQAICPHCDYDFPVEGKPSSYSPCHVCGGNAYSWGSLQSPGHWLSMDYADSESSLAGKIFSTAGETAHARLCKGCGNIQLFANSFVDKFS